MNFSRNKQGVLLGFFREQEDAARALEQLRRRGYRKVALLQKTKDGKIRSQRGLGAPFGLSKAPLKAYARYLVTGENMLMLKAPFSSLAGELAILRRIGETQPSIFTFHPDRKHHIADEETRQTPLTSNQFRQHARELATRHRLMPSKGKDEPLLKRLDRCERVIQEVRRGLEDVSKLDQRISTSAEWILDNAYIVQGQINDVRLNLPKGFYRELPVLDSEPHRGLPRIYNMAKEMIQHTDGWLDRHNIGDFLAAYQSVSALTIGELWAFPMMLRIALLTNLCRLTQRVDLRLHERESADFWAHRLLAASRRDPNQLLRILAEMAERHPEPSPHFASQITSHLFDEDAALVPVRTWLEQKMSIPLAEMLQREQSEQAADRASIGNAITSLRQLTLLDWREIFEQQSMVEKVLVQDPSAHFRMMDFATRDSYRNAIEEISRASKLGEEDVARKALELASAAREQDGEERLGHVGWWLIGKGRPELLDTLATRDTWRRRWRRALTRNASPAYIGALAAMTLALMAAVLITGLLTNAHLAWIITLSILSAFPASQLTLQLLNYTISRTLTPRALPKMSFKRKGIPDEFRTLVIIPMLSISEEVIDEEVRKLEIRFLANPGNNLLYGLFGDFTDADTESTPRDEAIIRHAVAAVEELGNRYGEGRFFFFHRGREWCESEGRYIGWERKRGKLEELNRLLSGETPRAGSGLVQTGDASLLDNVRFIITLDADTELPRDTARRMVETLAHPLNRPWLSEDGQRVIDGYTLIQPRVSTGLPSAMTSLFSRIYTDPTGTDPYTRAVSDVYQDLAGEGSYHGKGIYDLRAFHQVLTNRFPEQTILSHDLIEGAHVRVGLATDIELYDDFPADYRSFAMRQHRWIRGDWQIADWATGRVPGSEGGKVANPLGSLSRWKVFDNLRRSMVTPALVLLLPLSWFAGAALALATAILAGLVLLFPVLVRLSTWLLTPSQWMKLSRRELGYDFIRTLTDTALLPHQTWMTLDASMRALYRRFISRKMMLEWTTAAMAKAHAGGQSMGFMMRVAVGAALALLIIVLMATFGAPGFWSSIPFLALWLAGPPLAMMLNRPDRDHTSSKRVSREDRLYLRRVARRTWRYFDDFITDDTHWMPPDNFQVSYDGGLAMRTSPTNVGLWMLSVLAAQDFGFIRPDDAIDRIERSFESLDKLERYHGHLLNWYDLNDLRPLEPRYVSTVDSGNLLGSLWALSPGIREIYDRPLLRAASFKGPFDSLRLLMESIDPDRLSAEPLQVLDSLDRLLSKPSNKVLSQLRQIREASNYSDDLILGAGMGSRGEVAEASYWNGKLREELDSLTILVDRYLAWMELLAEVPQELLPHLGEQGQSEWEKLLNHAPSMSELAHNSIPVLDRMYKLAENDSLQDSSRRWIERLQASFRACQERAALRMGQAENVIAKAQELASGMNMRFLYDRERRLFSIGYKVGDETLDGSYYDLLASEARLTSFVAIARGDVPAEHWLSLSRPYGMVNRKRVLLSWGGTMFEYLMPTLFQRVIEKSLLDKSCSDAVDLQIHYGQKQKTPWGISESAFSDLDAQNTYQYKAFGAPGLGLKRGLDNDLVVSPYSTLMAVPIKPKESIANLRKLEEQDLYGHYGFFESIDYGRQRRRAGEHGVVVHAYMIHHQAMGFLALSNFLFNGILQDRFHADPRVQATEPLLYERIPIAPPLYKIPLRQWTATRMLPADVAPATRSFETPHTRTPQTLLLGNGKMNIMLTAAGGGYSRWKDINITRWRADGTRDNWGSFCFFRNEENHELWSNTHQPLGKEAEEFTVNFAADRARFRRLDHGIHCETEVIVAPEDDLEIRQITLSNRKNSRKRIEVTSFFELALAEHRADRQHQAYSKLFVETEFIPEMESLLAQRQAKEPGGAAIWAGHRIVFNQKAESGLQFETDRRNFLWRGWDTSDPAAMGAPLSGAKGRVLDSIFSLRKSVVLEPQGRIRFNLLLAVSESREGVLAILERYGDEKAITRELELAWRHAQLQLRHLRIQPDEARRFQQLAAHVIYPSRQFRAPEEKLRQNRLGQPNLWVHGISGDLPMVAVSVGQVRDMSLVRQLLLAHNYWRRNGLKADLLILNEESTSYDKPLQEQLMRLVQANSPYTGVDQPGGVFLRRADQISEDDLHLLLAASHVHLVAARGPLPQQFGLPVKWSADTPSRSFKTMPEEPSFKLPFQELVHENGLGGFTPDGREYVITLNEGEQTPAPWINVMSNPEFGALVSESGAGFCWFGNSQQNRLNAWANDPVSDPPSDAIYIRDEESGQLWSPTPLPIRESEPYRIRHGAGYTRFQHNSHAIEQDLLTFVPMDDGGGQPLRVQRLSLRNNSGRRRSLTVTFYSEWTLGENREDTQLHVVTQWEEKAGVLFARNRFHSDYGHRLAFAAMSPHADSHSADRVEFLGRNGHPARPSALKGEGLSGRSGAGLDPCVALQRKIALDPGEEREFCMLLGQGASKEEVLALVARFTDQERRDEAFQATQDWWDKFLGAVQVETPDTAANIMLNRWLPYQALSCRIWGRSALYQSGGAVGFRDQLQDSMALMHSSPQLVREQILRAASRQFREGDVQHWWHPQSGAGIRSRCSDDLLWLPYVTARYVEMMDEEGILHEQVPFLEAPPLADDQHEIFVQPIETVESATLFEHCRLAIQKGLNLGERGLPLMGSGDWNDGMNRVGLGGKGESVWMAWFLADVLRSFAGICQRLGREDEAQGYLGRAEQLAGNVEKSAWDGDWYLRAFYDDGTPLGSKDSQEARLDSLSQSWAAISGYGNPERTRCALDSAKQELVRPEDRLVLLFAPPFENCEEDPGYIKNYPPGVRENGGQYTHAATWLAKAFAMQGRGDEAYGILDLLNPITHARDLESAHRYRVEPYVIAADVYKLEGHVGMGGWSWYTGAASWYFRVWIEDLLGLQLSGSKLRLQPNIPESWNGFKLSYRHGRSIYQLEVEGCGQVESLQLDGRRLEGNALPLEDDGAMHRVLVKLSTGSKVRS